MATNSSSPNTGIPTDIASTLLNVNYGTVSILVLWLYEYAITLDDEITFLRDSRWSIVKIIYLLCRYLMFPFVITNIFNALQQGLTLEECKPYVQFSLFAGTTIVICAERKETPSPVAPSAKRRSTVMFLVRTYALWHRSRAALVIILVNFTAFLVPLIVILVLFDSGTTMIPISSITSCIADAQSDVLVWAYVIFVIGETEILLSTVYQAVRYYRGVGGGNRLLAILVQNNVFYFCCSLASSVTVVSTMYSSPGPYNTLLATLQAVIHGILVTRMHRSLWNSDRKNENPSNANDISLPTMHFRSLPQAK
ncbi:hypothetical protein PAXINDRAFT_15996 [Paxillus involutus ATCC 200175]|uniref:DUF6533 domain-containing protein n=1 Tax=Paxillus involutus ATCC 200175 TaxID=664439 RepID=A0A0C9T5V7_PAXIN|nr:hypothetical protein PAXINDRAFT_15996 [Paxillus involutus ATCC 200175]